MRIKWKMPEGDNFMHMQTRPLWTDWPQNLRVGWGPRRNQLCHFFENRSRGLGAGVLQKTAFPIESVHRPYNSVSTTVLHCDTLALLLSFPFPFANGRKSLFLLCVAAYSVHFIRKVALLFFSVFFHLIGLGGVKPFSFRVLLLIQFIFDSFGTEQHFPSLCCSLFSLFHSLGGASVLFRFFFHLLGPRGHKTVFLSCVAAYSLYISFAGGAKAFSFFVLQLIQFIFSFARWRYVIYVILVCFKIVPTQNPYFSTQSHWTVITVSSDLVLHFRLKISSFLPF